jgi:tetratricopeptide (TPR) repeat protein
MSSVVRPLTIGLIAAYVSQSAPAGADDPPAVKPDAPAAVSPLLADEVPSPLVPLHPRTAVDREKVDVIRLYSTARALEDRGERRAAIALLERALKKEPDSVAVLRRLSNLCLVTDQADRGIAYAQRVIEAEPGDTVTLGRLVEHYLRRRDPAGAEAFLRKLLTNPRLDKASPGYLLIQRDLGDLYSELLQQPEKAADAYALLVEGLDQRAANGLSLADQRRILRDDEAEAYARFGEAFSQARRYDLAVKAFRRGMAYAPDDPLLPQFLARALLRAGKGQAALAEIEPLLRKQPQGREPWDLLVEILTALKRSAEILPRLEAASKADSKNTPLRYILAERYRDGGEPEKAEAIYKELVQTQPDPRGFGSLSAALLRDKKYDELVELLGKAMAKPDTLEAVRPQVESIINSPAIAGAVLDAGLALQQADPPKLGAEARKVLSHVAMRAKLLEKFIPIQRLALRREANPQAYKEFFVDLDRAGRSEEAAAVLEELMEKYPAEKTPPILVALAQTRIRLGKNQEALTTLEDALKRDDGDADALYLKGYVLGQLGKNDDAIAVYKSMIQKFAGNNDEAVHRARSGLSFIYVNLERFDEGEKELEILLEKDPDDAGVNNDLGYLYADRGKNLDKAETMIRKAVDEEPDKSSYLDSLGWVLFKRGKVQEALEPLEKAVKDPANTDATIFDHLGDVYFKLNDLAKARAAWQQAERLASRANPPEKRLAEVRKKLESLGKLEAAGNP